MIDVNAIRLLSCHHPKGFVATISNFIFPFHRESRTRVHGVKTVIFG